MRVCEGLGFRFRRSWVERFVFFCFFHLFLSNLYRIAIDARHTVHRIPRTRETSGVNRLLSFDFSSVSVLFSLSQRPSFMILDSCEQGCQ
jgi:hypothetical protein